MRRVRLARLLYGAHLALLITSTQDIGPHNPRPQGGPELLTKGLALLPALGIVVGDDVLDCIDTLFGDGLATPVALGRSS